MNTNACVNTIESHMIGSSQLVSDLASPLVEDNIQKATRRKQSADALVSLIWVATTGGAACIRLLLVSSVRALGHAFSHEDDPAAQRMLQEASRAIGSLAEADSLAQALLSLLPADATGDLEVTIKF